MFQSNKKHFQNSFFGFQSSLPDKLKKELHNSEEYFFYKIIFCNIKEEPFRILYSEKASRPNAPVNCLVGALILKQKYNWTFEELFKRLYFDILTKTALGLDTLDEIPFDDATIFNFQNRLLKHHVETGENLLEQVFDSLTKEQIRQLKIKTNIQRSDSVMANSNIRSYGRLQLLVEVLLRLWKTMNESDKAAYGSKFFSYSGKTSGQYIYKLSAGELSHEIERLARLYHFCKTYILPKYNDTQVYEIFERVYNEHFTEVDSKVEVRPAAELSSSCLQSPDDLDATYREKRNEGCRGQSINIVETASKDNPVNLIVDISVNSNNIEDSQVLSERIGKILEKTPDLQEFHSDGGYGNPANDLQFDESGITHVQTAVRGRQCEVDIVIAENALGAYHVSCPLQSAESQASGKRYKALFSKTICHNCRFAAKCPAVERKSNRTYYFTREDYLRNKRLRNILAVPLDRRKIRANVEATVHEFTCRMTNKKLKVRGAFKAKLFAFSTAIAINFGRIFRYGSVKPSNIAVFCLNCVQIVKELSTFSKKFKIYSELKFSLRMFLIKCKIYHFFIHRLKLCF